MRVIGENKRGYPTFPGLTTDIRVVLVAGEIGDYAAYIGIGPTEFVARHGDKLFFEEAKMHFPGIEKEKYRP